MYNKYAKHYRELFMNTVDEHIAEYRNGVSIKEIASNNKVSSQFVAQVFIELGVKNKGRRTYTLNEHYFDEIDTQEKAYYLGLLYADGCNNVSRHAIHLDLQEKDKEILEKFSSDINSNRPLRYAVRKDSTIYDRTIKKENIQPQWCMELSSVQLSEALERHGMVANKSLKLVFPNIEKGLYKHFIRGYYDGDGSLGKVNDKSSDYDRYFFSLVSTDQFCNAIKDILFEELGVTVSVRLAHPECNSITSVLRTMSNKNVKLITDWLYSDASVYLKRKHDRYIDYFYSEDNK